MPSDILKGIGAHVTAKRTAQRLTQEELAEKAGTSKQTISKIELGQQEPGAKIIVGLANALGISTDFLLMGDRSNVYSLVSNEKIQALSESQYIKFEDYVGTQVNMYLSWHEKEDEQ